MNLPIISLADFGAKIRKQRNRMALTLDELAAITGISKPYLSLIETAHVPSPPSNEKLTRLEVALKLPAGDLTTTADLLRTPPGIRDFLLTMLADRGIDLQGAAEAVRLAIATASTEATGCVLEGV